MKKLYLLLILFLLTGCAGVQKKQEKEPTRDEIIDMKLKQTLAIAETSLEISKKSEEMAKQALETSNQANSTSDKALEAANKAIAAANEARKFTEEETKKAIDAANKATDYADQTANKAIKAANDAIDAANKSSDKSISVANQTIAEINRLRATMVMKPEEEPIIMEEPKTQNTYTIKKGDTLSEIAKKFYGNSSKWQQIYEKNKKVIKNPNVLIPGTNIIIP